jgi:hypothetical protein
MNNEQMFPICCNHFGVGTNNGQTFILEFRYQEPPGEHGQPGEIRTFSRVAIDRIGLERFTTLLRTTLDKTKNQGGGSDQVPPASGRF